MLTDYIDQIETIGLNLFFAILFLLIGLSIQDVLKKSDVPRYGRMFVWLVLFLGCAGFVVKGLIQVGWETFGLG